MLRVAVPYGTLTSRQLRMLAHIARYYDKGYGHLSTRQNMQFNWPDLAEVPDILADLASVQMHAIQTSGNCIRNVTTDQFAGVAADETVDGRPYCELIRQWSTAHPEFNWLPRKFKIAVNGSASDRAAIDVHDIGIEARSRWHGSCIRHQGWRRTGTDARHRQSDSLRVAGHPPAHVSRSNPARLQPLRSARQQAQGANQDSGARADARGISRASRRGVGAFERRPDDVDSAGNRSRDCGVRRPHLIGNSNARSTLATSASPSPSSVVGSVLTWRRTNAPATQS